MNRTGIAITVCIVSVLPLLNLFILVQTIRTRARRIREIHLAAPLFRLLRYLIIMPVAAAVILPIFVFGIFHSDQLYRSAHAVFLAGIAMTAVLQVIMQSVPRGLAHVYLYISGLASEVVVLAGTVYFALFRRFAVVFPKTLELLPLILGILLLVAATTILVITLRLADGLQVTPRGASGNER